MRGQRGGETEGRGDRGAGRKIECTICTDSVVGMVQCISQQQP